MVIAKMERFKASKNNSLHEEISELLVFLKLFYCIIDKINSQNPSPDLNLTSDKDFTKLFRKEVRLLLNDKDTEECYTAIFERILLEIAGPEYSLSDLINLKLKDRICDVDLWLQLCDIY
ncbi:MAG: hypothetical protein MHPSP_004902, partial [Paramarteilia canceri]